MAPPTQDPPPADDERPAEGSAHEIAAAPTDPAPEQTTAAREFVEIGPGRLTRDQAIALLDRGGDLMASGDYEEAQAYYGRVVGFDDPEVTAAALLGLAQARYRSDDEAAAIATWESILELPETPSTYIAWREVAAARVRDGDLQGAIAAYRQADRRAPLADKAEIANRLGWLAKETGNTGASRRYFARGRGGGPLIPASMVILAGTAVVSASALFTLDGEALFGLLQLDKVAVAAGEVWRLWSVTLLHANLLHFLFNMYALYLAGPVVEQMYGSRLFVLFYLVSAAGGSLLSFAIGPGRLAVGASGAVFGLLGILLIATRIHHPVIDRRSRAFVGQLGTLLLINVIFGLIAGGRIDNAAHAGGFIAGAVLAVAFVPGKVPTMSRLWQGAPGAPASGAQRWLVPTIGLLLLAAGMLIAWTIGLAAWR